ncbi:MAG TPA: hypothetical protein VK472_00145 [Allosphingosinicella sp.]|nr:hypothetical protein [Allosphingosinicella sp.]
MREATILIAAMGTAAWLVVLGLSIFAGSDPATADLDSLVGIGTTILYAFTAAPALALALYRRAPRAAFGLAIAFPALLGLAFAVGVLMWQG